MTTAAQDEFNDLVAKNSERTTTHPEDRPIPTIRREEDLSEEDAFREQQIDAAMRATTQDDRTNLMLPPASFDSGCYTGVKGVIADARHFELARKSRWRERVNAARRSIFGVDANKKNAGSDSDSDARSDHTDEDSFLNEWRENRRRQLEADSGRNIQNRRTSPSVRHWGRLDSVDAMGYLDAIEKVRRDTTVVVFVYDADCQVSRSVEKALVPLVSKYHAIHFVKVRYEDIEFEPAATPSLLAYKNQGDLFANMTGLIELMSDEDDLTGSLQRILEERRVITESDDE